jgi:hypothetical protein
MRVGENANRYVSSVPAPRDMVWIPGGAFRMGSDRHYPEEAPAHQVRVDSFFIDPLLVTRAPRHLCGGRSWRQCSPSDRRRRSA